MSDDELVQAIELGLRTLNELTSQAMRQGLIVECQLVEEGMHNGGRRSMVVMSVCKRLGQER